MTLPTFNLLVILPELILVGAALLVLVLDLLGANKRALGWFSLRGGAGRPGGRARPPAG